MARLGLGVFAALVHALQRSLGGGDPLVVEYGITEPNPEDKYYVDPLRDWDVSPINYYHDSFGRRVYLSANSPTGLAIALEFRDLPPPTQQEDNDPAAANDPDPTPP